MKLESQLRDKLAQAKITCHKVRKIYAFTVQLRARAHISPIKYEEICKEGLGGALGWSNQDLWRGWVKNPETGE